MEKQSPNIMYTVNHDLCTGCGVCVGACLNKAISISVNYGNFRPIVNKDICKNSSGCHRCFEACPGVGINLVEKSRELFKEDAILEDEFLGRFLKCYVGYSKDENLRYHAASGGSISQFLIWLLENKIIDGAVVTKFDAAAPLKVKTFIAKTKDDVIAAKSSKYAPTTLAEVLRPLKDAEGNRYVVVGVPCQVEGVRKLLAIDKNLRDKVCGLFSVFCSGSRSFGFTEYVMKERHIDLNRLNYLAYRDNGCLGGLVAKGEGIDYYEDYQRYCHPLRSIFFPRRCILCADHFGELSDISFGDIHVAPYNEDKVGINSVIARTSYWKDMLEAAKQASVLELSEISSEKLLESQKMARVKKNRNIAFCLLLKKFRKKAPDYGTTYGAKLNVNKILDYVQIRFQQFVGRHKLLWRIIPFLKAKVRIH